MTTRAELRATGAFTDYPDGELDLLVSVSTARRFAAKSDLCREGTVGASCYCIVSGTVDVIKRMPAGDAPVSTLGPGAIVGQIALVHRVPRTATLRGAKRTVSVKVPEGVDISKIKVGDEVRAVMIEALVLNVERVAAGK